MLGPLIQGKLGDMTQTQVAELIAGNASVLSSSLIICAARSSDTPSLKNTSCKFRVDGIDLEWILHESYYFNNLE